MDQDETFYCSLNARANGEPLIGTATYGDIWFLIEEPSAWGAKAFEESAIPPKVKQHITNFTVAGKKVRILLIRQPHRKRSEKRKFFIAITHPLNPRLYEFTLSAIEELLELDLGEIVQGEAPVPQRQEPLFLVCTNGKRDRCCARFGMQVYQRASQITETEVWQSSHIGGHRLGPVMLVFPHGVNYGRVSPDHVEAIIRDYKQGKLYLENYRGMVAYPPQVQAAEHYLRIRSSERNIEAIRPSEVEVISNNEWDISLDYAGTVYHLHVKQEHSAVEIPSGCETTKVSPITLWLVTTTKSA